MGISYFIWVLVIPTRLDALRIRSVFFFFPAPEYSADSLAVLRY
jgi:hypothetical protein